MSRLISSIGMIAFMTLVAPAQQKQPWQINAEWCTTDPGSSGAIYYEDCPTHDQYDSVLACQQDAERGHPNDKTSQTIVNAGRNAVDSYMEDKIPANCKRTAAPSSGTRSPDFYVVRRYECVDGEGDHAGDCTITQHSKASCQDASNRIDAIAESQNVCYRCPADPNTTTPGNRVSKTHSGLTGWGPCYGW